MNPFTDNIIQRIHDADPKSEMRQRRFSKGTVVGYAGGVVTVDVGARLGSPSNPVYMEVPCASGFTPVVGQVVCIVYATDSPHSGYVVATGPSAATG